MNIAHQGLLQVKGAVEAVGLQHVADAAIEALDPLPGSALEMHKRDAVCLGDFGGVRRGSISGAAQSVSNSCSPVAARLRRPKRRSVNALPLGRVAFYWIRTFPLHPKAAIALANALGVQRDFD
jgi:hypothetical protein